MIKVACAIIEQNGNILLVRRSVSMTQPGKWELPGGKIELDESPAECIRREILEELGIQIKIAEQFASCQTGDILLIPFRCTINQGSMLLTEHDFFEWVVPEKTLEFDLAPADIPVLIGYCLFLNPE